MKVLTRPLDALSRDARAYPVHLLKTGETGLCLFAAGFLGVNDAVHMARMEMRVTCVDTDEAKLREMQALYPDDWAWRVTDAWKFAEHHRTVGMTYDVVSVDTWTGDLAERSLGSLEVWCSLARRLVTATVGKGQTFKIPAGWEWALYERSEIADWLVLTRAAVAA